VTRKGSGQAQPIARSAPAASSPPR
jgi:hypothetical protein